LCGGSCVASLADQVRGNGAINNAQCLAHDGMVHWQTKSAAGTES
jgi:hypothetical protein